jgi:hypothetical protein
MFCAFPQLVWGLSLKLGIVKKAAIDNIDGLGYLTVFLTHP